MKKLTKTLTQGGPPAHESPFKLSQEISTYTELRQQIHHDLRIQHPERIETNGESTSCDSYEARLMEQLLVATHLSSIFKSAQVINFKNKVNERRKIMTAKRTKKPKKFTDTLRSWIVARDTDGNVIIGREVIEGICDSGRTKRCFVIEGLPPQGVVGNN